MMRRVFTIVSFWILAQAAFAQDFVPFVIPAEPNPRSAMFRASEAISTRSLRVTSRDGHFSRGNKRVRFWGVNLAFNGNFPNRADAPRIAARLAAAGVNMVRLHHMDTSNYPGGLWNAADGATIAPQALERLDFFIAELARRGIYVDLNLHVGREHSKFLGLPAFNREYDKMAGIFTPALVEAQRKFAREMLTRVNAFRGLPYAADPAVAIVEISNEDSFFMWGAEKTLRELPPYYAGELTRQYNAWLLRAYGDTLALRATWSRGIEPLGKNLVANGDFTAKDPATGAPQHWRLEQYGEAKAALSAETYKSRAAARMRILNQDGVNWHIQLNQAEFAVERERFYSLSFRAAAATTRMISCSVMMAHEPWSNLSPWETLEVAPEWKAVSLGFRVNAGDAKARLNFALGDGAGDVYLADVQLRPGGQQGLLPDESLENRSVGLYADPEGEPRKLDRTAFLADTEKAYYEGMRDYVHEDLGCAALVIGTIVFGPLGFYGQSGMDFVDGHAYWQHPRFPHREWDMNDWLVEQTAMSDRPEGAVLLELAASRLAGKPFTVSEYNHPAPLDSQAECVPMIAAFAAAQDFDGVWIYAYSHKSDGWRPDKMDGFFDIAGNPAKWGFMRAGAAIFRDGGIPALNESVTIPLTGRDRTARGLALRHDLDSSMFGIVKTMGHLAWRDLLDRRIYLSFSKSAPSRSPRPPATTLTWTLENSRGAFFAEGDGGWVYTGRASSSRASTKGRLDFSQPGFAAICVTALDRSSFADAQKVLITACGRCENEGMGFREDRRTVGTNWGKPPVRIEPVRGSLGLPPGKWTCEALSPDGMPSAGVPVSYQDGRGRIEVSPQYKTMWYLLDRSE